MQKYYSIILFILFNTIYSQNISNYKLDSIYLTINSEKAYKKESLENAIKHYKNAIDNDNTINIIKSLVFLAKLEFEAKNYSKSIQYIDELKKNCLLEDNFDVYIFANCLESKIFFKDKNYTRAYSILYNAQTYLPEINNLENKTIAKININISKWWLIYSFDYLNKFRNRNTLISISKEICSDAASIKDKKTKTLYTLSGSTLAAISLLGEEKINEAKTYLEIAEKNLDKDIFFSFQNADFYNAKGDYEYLNKKENLYNLDSAISNYQKALRISQKINYNWCIINVYPKISSSFGDKSNFDLQKYYFEKGKRHKDSIESIDKFKLNNFKQYIYTLKSESSSLENKTYKILSIILFFIFLILSVFYYLKNKKIKNKINSNTYPTLVQTENTTEKQIPLNHLLQLIKNDKEKFYPSFIESFPNFEKNIHKINPSLKRSDLEFCAFLKLNLDTKQISVLQNISIRAVEGKKYRLRKKLDISSDENFYIWMSKL